MSHNFAHLVRFCCCLMLLSPIGAVAQNVAMPDFGDIVDGQASRQEGQPSPSMGEDAANVTAISPSIDYTGNLSDVFAMAACGETDQPAKAVEACSALIKVGLNIAAPFVFRGLAYLRLGNIEAATQDFDRAASFEAILVDVRYTLAYGLIETGRYKEAVAQLSKYIEQKPDASQAYSERSYALHELGDLERALSDINRAIELDPNNESALVSRLGILRDIAKSIGSPTDLVQLIPRTGDLVARGNALHAAQKYADAIALYSRALEQEPDNVDALTGRGSAFDNSGLYMAAEIDFSRALQYEPDNIVALSKRAVIYSALGRLDEAEADAQKVIEVAPTYGHSYLALGSVAFRREEFADAIAAFDDAIKFPKSGQSFLAFLLRGSSHRRLGNLDNAMADLVSTAASRRPSSPQSTTLVSSKDRQRLGIIISADQAQLPATRAAIDIEISVDVLQHVGDEVLDGRLPLPEQRQARSPRRTARPRRWQSWGRCPRTYARGPSPVGQTFPDDVRGVHVRALPEGRAQRGHQRIGITGRHDRHAVDGRVVDLGRGTGVRERDVEGKDIDLRDA